MSTSSFRNASHVTRLVVSGLVLLTCFVFEPPPSIAALALDFNGGNQGFCNPQFAGPGCTVGSAFQIDTPMRVLGLGVFDQGADGLAGSHAVGIFDAGGSLLVSATASNASTAVPSIDANGQWLVESISPFILDTGTYTIGILSQR